MNRLTKIGLNFLQRAKLDNFLISLLNKKNINSLMLKYCWQQKGYDRYYRKYLAWNEIMKKNNISLAAKSILEVGSGASLGLGYFFLDKNFKDWTASDYYRCFGASKSLIKKEIKLINEVREKFNKNILADVKIVNGQILLGDRLKFIKLELSRYCEELNNRFDLVISSDTFEHLEKETVKPIINNLNKYLKKGGLMINEIDLKDHVNPANPHGFLKYSDLEWNGLTRGTIFYTNRLRSNDYVKIFEDLNLKVKFIEKQNTPIPLNLKINKQFLNYDKNDIEAVKAYIVCEKTYE